MTTTQDIRTAIIALSDKGIGLAKLIQSQISGAEIVSPRLADGVRKIDSAQSFMPEAFEAFGNIIFVGALGICVRSIAPYLGNKNTDPAVISVDAAGLYVQSVIAGHIGGGNALAQHIARITGGHAVISTSSDIQHLWALDIIHRQFGWKATFGTDSNAQIAHYINGGPTALLLEARDAGTAHLEHSCPEWVTIFYRYADIDFSRYGLLIAVTPYEYDCPVPAIMYRPPMLALGAGCRKGVDPQSLAAELFAALRQRNISPDAIGGIYSIDIKKNEQALIELGRTLGVPFTVYTAEQLRMVNVPNPSEKVFQTVGCYGIAEAAAMYATCRTELLVEKQKEASAADNDFTFAVAVQHAYERSAFVHIVGAGPGDPELVSVRGKRLLGQADLILYAGSLVPVELTHYAKPGATVLSSAGMDLDEQIACMSDFYRRGLVIVRLHTGDPCLYGAIQEQMSKMDELGMQYAITPGISAFQAAAAALRSQFTVPERVQSIILTRGEGRTPMPEKEQLPLLARSQSTMCIYLSATLVDQVQEDLLTQYPPETPVAVCHKLTWPEEQIWTGQLRDLAHIVRSNKLTLTTLLVVGEAIGARGHYSKLYDKNFSHGTRKGVE